MGISRKMKDKDWTDSQGRKGKVRKKGGGARVFFLEILCMVRRGRA
jgi:hypothetical protein